MKKRNKNVLIMFIIILAVLLVWVYVRRGTIYDVPGYNIHNSCTTENGVTKCVD